MEKPKEKNKIGSGYYEDIINLPHPESEKHPRMSRSARAAQFAPFAALTGHDEVIDDTAEKHIEDWNETSGEGLFREDFEESI